MMTINAGVSPPLQALPAPASPTQFWLVMGTYLESIWSFLSDTTYLGLPLYVYMLGIAILGALFALLSNKKRSGG